MKRTRIAVATLFAVALGATPALAQAADGTIVLGAAVSLTGKYSVNGKNTQDGYNLAVKAINDKGGIDVGGKHYKLEIRYYDDESTSARGAQLVERLISQDHIDFILGPYSSALTKAIAPITEKYRVPMVEGNGADRVPPLRVPVRGAEHLRLLPARCGEHPRRRGEEGGSRSEVGQDRHRHRERQLLAGRARRRDRGCEEVRHAGRHRRQAPGRSQRYDGDPHQGEGAEARRADDLGHEKGAVLGIRQVAQEKVYVPMLALTHCDAAQITKKFGKDSDYAFCASQWDASLTYTDPWFGNAQKYAEAFRKAYNYDPPYQAAESTASVEVFADAIARAGSLDRGKVRDALARTDLMTLYGPVKFDATGKNTAKSMVMYQVQDEDYVVVAPAKWATAKPIYPAPTWAQRESGKKVGGL